MRFEITLRWLRDWYDNDIKERELKSLFAYLNFERVADFDALHPLRAQHVVRDQLHLCRQGETDHLLTTTTIGEDAEMRKFIFGDRLSSSEAVGVGDRGCS